MTRLCLACLAAVLAVASPVGAENLQVRAITVNGEGMVSATPDTAEVIAGVQTRESTARAALTRNSAAMTKVVDAIRKAGIADKDIQTARISLSPLFQQNDRGAERLPAGYLAANRVVVRMRDLARVGALLDAVVAAGANDLGGVRFLIAEPQPLMDRARRAAVEDATRRAKLLADAAGVRVGKVLRIDETGIRAPRPMMYQAEVAARASAAPISVGEQEIRATVSMRFEVN